MKIDSRDAQTMPLHQAQETFKSKVDLNKIERLDSKKVNIQKDVGKKNISQITTQDKNELTIADKTMLEAILKANRALEGSNRKLEYSVHKPTKEVVVKVINTDTNEVVREIPSEKILDMVAKMWEKAGLLIDERR